MKKNLINVGEMYILKGDIVHDELVGTKIIVIEIDYDGVWFIGVRGVGFAYDTQLDAILEIEKVIQ